MQYDSDIAKERLISDQSASELAPLLSVDERALLSILSTCELHQDLDAKKLLRGYADETGLGPAKELAEEMIPGADPLEAASKIDGLMSTPCKVALNSSRASGTLRSFGRSWLSQTVDDRSTWVRHENTNAAVMGRLGIRLFICANLLTFILLFVIPEHQKMYEEFGLEVNQVMFSFLWIADWFAKLFPLFLLLVLCLLLYVLIFRRSIMANYLRRWYPGRWRLVSLPTHILNRKLLAWDLLAFRGDQQDKRETDWDAMVGSRTINSNESIILKNVASRETQAWLLRNMADQSHRRRNSRFSFGINMISFVFQVALGAIIVLAAFSVFSMMLQLMGELSKL